MVALPTLQAEFGVAHAASLTGGSVPLVAPASVLFIVASGPDGLAVHRQSKKRLERLVRQFHDRVRPRLDARELRRGLRQHALHEEARGNEFSLHPSVRLLG